MHPKRLYHRLIFDSLFFAYSFIVTAVCLAPIFGFNWDKDQWTQNFNFVCWCSLAMVIVGFVISFFALKLNLPTVGAALFADSHRPSPRQFWGLHLALIFILSIVISLQITQASLSELLDRDGLTGAWRLWSGLSHPNFSLLSKAIVEAIETIFIAFLATAIAVPIAFILAFFCAKNIMSHPLAIFVYSFFRMIMNISRSVEPLIWALIFTVWVGVGPFAGMLALMVHSVASLAKYYSEILESVDDKPIDGVRSTGANAVQVVWFSIVPQIFLPYIAMTIYRWDTNVRMATVIGLVGGGGIGTLLIQYQGQAMWPEVGCIILVIAFIVWLMDLASAYVREALK